MEKKFSRRQFLGLGATAAVAAGVAGLAGCAPAAPAASEPMAATGTDAPTPAASTAPGEFVPNFMVCLLYTSDAADD